MKKESWQWMDDDEVGLCIQVLVKQMCQLCYGPEAIGKFLALSIRALIWANTNIREDKK